MRHEKPSLNNLNKVAKSLFKESLQIVLKRKNVSIDDYFTHFIGHSIGLEVHDIDCAILGPGSVFTIEPGLYFYGDENESLRSIGGIRIEDMYYINDRFELVCLSGNIH